jgi:hypothetical protein
MYREYENLLYGKERNHRPGLGVYTFKVGRLGIWLSATSVQHFVQLSLLRDKKASSIKLNNPYIYSRKEMRLFRTYLRHCRVPSFWLLYVAGCTIVFHPRLYSKVEVLVRFRL